MLLGYRIVLKKISPQSSTVIKFAFAGFAKESRGRLVFFPLRSALTVYANDVTLYVTINCSAIKLPRT